MTSSSSLPMGMPSTDVKPLSGNSSAVPSSSPLKMRIRSSRGIPLFPTSTAPLSQQVNMSSDSEKDIATPKDASNPEEEISIVKKKEEESTYKFKSMAEMIRAHIEELDQRPPLGSSKMSAEKDGEGVGKSQKKASSVGGERNV
ncbi:hypothetical protein F4804DRAFT_337050 [Jackrogersella minutella]|nr:hypothetical protein F4804DRAFT_337050 [Jackrogersella minutella]